MQQINLTLPINEQTVSLPSTKKTPPAFSRELSASVKKGDPFTSHRFAQKAHLGTHVDSPAHYVEDGQTIDEVELQKLTGSARVVDFRDVQGKLITDDMLENAVPDLSAGDRLLLITGDVDKYIHNPEEPDVKRFFKEASAIAVSGAEWLINREIAFVANDFVTENINVDTWMPYKSDHPVHNNLLHAGIPIGEYLCNTHKVADYDSIDLTCLPIPITGLEAAPTRVIASVS